MAVAPLDVLCCRITIGDPDAGNPMSILNPITLTEVQEVEIVETYKKLIGTATIRFPKGTIFRSTIMPVRSDGVPDLRGIPVRSGPGGEAIVISMRSRRSSWLSMSLSMAV
mgnify:CR=1 FL=1